MQSQRDVKQTASLLLSAINHKLISCHVLQSLWAGYGHMCEITALPPRSTECSEQEPTHLILKYVSPPATDPKLSPKEGHLRKMLSYQIEQYFYSHLAPQMPPHIAVASCLSSNEIQIGRTATAMIMTDLRKAFPMAGGKRAALSETQVYAAIDWLAAFHGFWWSRSETFDRSKLCPPPLQHFERTKSAIANEGVWLNGGYTYLATRRDEYIALSNSDDSEWCAKLCSPIENLEGHSTVAELVAAFLAPLADTAKCGPISAYETLLHGDVKSENLFTTSNGDAAAFFDFQYVGLGLGVCDLAKLFTCSLPERLLTVRKRGVSEYQAGMGKQEEKLLRYYLKKLEQASGVEYEWSVFTRHWETALVDWLRFQASWGFWGNTAWLESRVRSILSDEAWLAWLSQR